MLRRMRRGHGGARLRELVERLRERVPDLVFRTAFIVGHPGETDADFDELCEFVEWAEFDHVGVFRYSRRGERASFAHRRQGPAAVAAERCTQADGLQRQHRAEEEPRRSSARARRARRRRERRARVRA